MNVPLIQKPETNDINASLIAIRKQLQILNESVNNIESKYLLKSELKELSADTVGGDGKYIESISESNGIINAVEKSLGNMTPVDTVTSGNMHSVTSNAVANAIQSAEYIVNIDNDNNPDNFPSDAMRIYRVKNYNIGWVGNDGLIIHIPWSDNYARQIALDDESNWIAQRVKLSGTWLPWKVLYDVNEDDNLEDITSQLNLNLGVTKVLVCRKNNLVNILIQGTYAGSPTVSTQAFINNLPDKYKTSISQTFAVVSYNTSQPYVLPSRIQVIDNHIDLKETDMVTGTFLRIGFMYMV